MKEAESVLSLFDESVFPISTFLCREMSATGFCLHGKGRAGAEAAAVTWPFLRGVLEPTGTGLQELTEHLFSVLLSVMSCW